MEFYKLLIAWYLAHKRTLPWRETTDPYAIWLSEIILQQTRVNQGLPYYNAFIQHFPTLAHLAEATEQTVLKLWQGLGYYSRARNLQKTARFIHTEKAGIFPTTYADLLQLPGIGPYTAAAIASFAYKEKVPAIDGNVFRVAARIWGLTDDTAQAKTRKVFWEHLQPLMSEEQPDLFNQAMMEFGATVCLPKNPDCVNCIFQDRCVAYQTNRVAALPVKSTKVKVKKRYLHYFWVRDAQGNIPLQQRSEKGIWQHLYELPLYESDSSEPDGALAYASDLWNVQQYEVVEPVVVHALSHQQLHIRFYRLRVHDVFEQAYTYAEVMHLPVPIVLHNFIKEQSAQANF